MGSVRAELLDPTLGLLLEVFRELLDCCKRITFDARLSRLLDTLVEADEAELALDLLSRLPWLELEPAPDGVRFNKLLEVDDDDDGDECEACRLVDPDC